MWQIVTIALLLFSACSPSSDKAVDALNEESYNAHYRDLRQVTAYADSAYRMAQKKGYDSGMAEALNNLAFVDIIRMDFQHADSLLKVAAKTTDNQVELLICDIQLMRLCQRQSHNKDFYVFRERAQRRLKRIEEAADELNAHQKERMIYAFSEYHIVLSTYFYYMSQTKASFDALYQIDPEGAILQDHQQTMNYYYNIGAGGIITQGSRAEIEQQEMEYLISCYYMAIHDNYPFWEANSLQAMSEHLQDKTSRDRLLRRNRDAMRYINVDNVPDSLLAGNFAERSQEIFSRYGDVYQCAGSYRTLAQCYWAIHDYEGAIYYLNKALNTNKKIFRAPDLVASIREQLSLAYSAIDDKRNSDYNRNLYLDLQEQTRQDRLLEARADQLRESSKAVNVMLVAVVVMVILVIVLLFAFDYMRRKNDRKFSIDSLLEPLEQWNEKNRAQLRESEERQEEINEEIAQAQLHLTANKRRNMEQRAKVHLVNVIRPLIDRIVNELDRMEREQARGDWDETRRKEQYDYILELTDKINEYNARLTQWIQLRQGELSLHIESFPVQQLFDVIRMSRMGFKLKGIDLVVKDTTAVVKADKTLTLFMLNTLADNARKFTPAGGTVTIAATEQADSVLLSVSDTGVGMSEERRAHIFDHKPIIDQPDRQSHGFGLMNCKGIIDKYRKLSRIFSVCDITAESKAGVGSTFRFHLPKGIVRMLAALLLMSSVPVSGAAAVRTEDSDAKTATAAVRSQHHDVNTAAADVQSQLRDAKTIADSCYVSNVSGRYDRTIYFADSLCRQMNRLYAAMYPDSTSRMTLFDPSGKRAAELLWFEAQVPMDYDVILSMRNECAIAAQALHRWDLYHYNNKVYTELYHASTADTTLPSYVKLMQKSEANKNVAIAILALLLLLIFPAYYVLYYRHKLFDRICVDRIGRINETLLSDGRPEEKLKEIDRIWKDGERLTSDRVNSLNDIVGQVKGALQQSIDAKQTQQTNIELAEDELRRIQLEDAKLHVSNNVLDNCLSTLKHETMYYPSRIRQLIEGADTQVSTLQEVVSYYRELYFLLSRQAMLAAGTLTTVDPEQVTYLFDLLRRHGVSTDQPSVEEKGLYVTLRLPFVCKRLTDKEAEDLFTPSTSDFDFLVCRQIVRDMGELTNLRGSGLRAMAAPRSEIIITLPKIIISIWKNSK